MKKVIVIGILGIVLVSLVSAGLLDYFGKIGGSVEVTGPVFYANSEEIDLFGKQVKELSINEFTISTSSYTIKNGESKVFWTKEFDEPLDFYKPEINLSVRSKIQEGIIPKNLKLIFGYYQGDNSREICHGLIAVNSNTTYKVYSTLCDSYEEFNLPIENIDGFYYEIKGQGTPDVETKVSLTNQNTKAQVLGVAT